jgi:hypothetical protein
MDIFEARKLEAAKLDLEDWKSFSEEKGESKPGHPTYKPRKSCQLFGDNCQSYDMGKCIFYRCHDRPSYKEWQKHHKNAHPEDNILYKALCDVCRQIRDEEARFMEGRISEFERELKDG